MMKHSKPELVILDRDGLINEDSDDYIKSSNEWRAIPGSIEAIIKLKENNIKVAIATNQSGIARGFFSCAELDKIHQKLYDSLATNADAIQHIACCPHVPDDFCECRKPKIGLLQEISQLLNIKLSLEVYFIGDSIKDIKAARVAGCTPVLVKTGKGLRTLANYRSEIDGIMVFNNLQQFVEWLI